MKQLNMLLSFILVYTSINANVTIIPIDQPTIQAGINSASDGDTILVNPGTYVENINFNGKNLVIGSLFLITNDTAYISQTVIDGNQSGSVVTFENEEDSSTVLSGFTITNGNGRPINDSINNGGGIYCDGASPKLEYLRIIDNHVTGSGGGIEALNSSLEIHNVEVASNSAGNTAGINFRNDFNVDLENSPKPTLSNSVVTNNTASSRAGGIYCNYALVTISNVEVTKNTAARGAALYIGNAKANLLNVTISDNTATNEGGIFYQDGSEATVINSILWNNSPQNIYLFPDPVFSTITVAYSDVQDGESTINSSAGAVNWEDGNIDVDPLFLSSDDYRLQTGSPCIDAGIPFFEWEEDTLINLLPDEYIGLAPDLGAYEQDPLSSIEPGHHLSSNGIQLQAYPNPFDQQLSLSLHLPYASSIEISLLNTLGSQIKQVAIPALNQGAHNLALELSDIPSGHYFIQVQTEQDISRAISVIKK